MLKKISGWCSSNYIPTPKKGCKPIIGLVIIMIIFRIETKMSDTPPPPHMFNVFGLVETNQAYPFLQ